MKTLEGFLEREMVVLFERLQTMCPKPSLVSNQAGSQWIADRRGGLDQGPRRLQGIPTISLKITHRMSMGLIGDAYCRGRWARKKIIIN